MSTLSKPLNRMRRITMSVALERAVTYVILAVFMFFFLYPFWIALMGALKSVPIMNATKVYEPTLEITFRPMIEALNVLRRPVVHSLVIAATTSILAMVGGMLGGYTLTVGRFRGMGIILTSVFFGIYIPGITKLLPTLKIVQWLGLYDTSLSVGLAVGGMMLPMATILYRQFYRQIPKSFYEVATIAGANHLDVFGYIIAPLSKIPTVTVAVLSLGTGWNVYLLPLVLTTGNPSDRPIGVALGSLRNAAMEDGSINVMLAAGLLAALPPILLYLFAQRYVTSGFRKQGGLDK